MNDKEKEKGIYFDQHEAKLRQRLSEWYDEESESIDAGIVNDAPSGSGGSIIASAPAIDSKRMLDASAVTKEVVGIDIPPEIIKPGGYETFDEMCEHLLPRLKDVYTGKRKVKDRTEPKKMVEV